MFSIYHYIKLQLKERLSTPVKSSILYLSPVLLLVIEWIIGQASSREDENDRKISKKFIYDSTVLLLLYIVLNYRIAYEIIREKQIFRKQHVHTYGFGLLRFYIAWEIIYAILIFISSVIVIAIVYIMGFLSHVNIIIAFLTFYLFQLADVSFFMFVSTFFSGLPTIGGILSVFLQIASAVSYLLVIYFEDYKKNHQKIGQHGTLTSIASSYFEVRKAELNGETINFSNLMDRNHNNIFFDMITSISSVLCIILLALFVDFFLYSIHASRNFTDRSSRSHFIKLIENKYNDTNPIHPENNNGVIRYLNELNVFPIDGIAISIKHLFKKYSNKIMAISDVSFDINDNEIFVITGPKNSGKSTLMKMLYGRQPSSFGYVYYKEGDNMKEMGYGKWGSLTHNISVAPKENYMFMESLSVSDHIKFYQSMTSSHEDGFALLNELHFTGNTSDHVKDLSEVEKTKVKIALALLKFQKYIFLEEPTAGMNEKDTLSFWNAIRARSTNRVIIVSTDNMEEAIHNGNRILVLKGGMVDCIGDSEYVRNRTSSSNSSEHKIDIKN